MKKIKIFYLTLVFTAAGITSLYAQSTVKDIDGNVYNTVKIGNQRWLKENLKVTMLNDGTPISNSKETQKLVYPDFIDIEEPRGWIYKEDPKNNEKYGKLYNWYAVKTGKLCPNGWRIPTIEEWQDLQQFLGWKNASKMMRTSDWKNVKTIGTNQSGFSALPAGLAQSGGNYYSLGEQAYFWSSSPGLTTENYPKESGAAIYLFTDNEDACPKSGSIMAVNRFQRSGLSCRCIEDEPTTASCEAKEAVMKYTASMIGGDRLSANEKLLSVNGRYHFRVTTDGNFVIEEILTSGACPFQEIYRFPINNSGNKPSVSIFSYNPDGNICMDSKQGKSYCITTGRDAAAALILQKSVRLEMTNDGRLVLINKDGQEIWTTPNAPNKNNVTQPATQTPAPTQTPTNNTACGLTIKYKGHMTPGNSLLENEILVSADGRYQLRHKEEQYVVEEVLNRNNCQFKTIEVVSTAIPRRILTSGMKDMEIVFKYESNGDIVMNSKRSQGDFSRWNAIKAPKGDMRWNIVNKSTKLELTNNGILRLVNGSGK